MASLASEPLFDVDEIQGNILRGFSTNHLELLGLKIGGAAPAKNWLSGLADRRIASLAAVHDYRLRRSANDPATDTEVLLNVAFSKLGLELVGVADPVVGDGLFNFPMGSFAAALGDRVVNGKPIDYVVGQNRDNTPDVLFLIGCQNNAALDAAVEDLQNQAIAAGMRVIYKERGHLLPGETEHFGYRDGISEVGVRGLLSEDPVQPLTLRHVHEQDPQAALFGRPGQPLVYPGQFVFGYPTQSIDPSTAGPVLDFAEWMRNGSLLVFRRLRQDVRAFRDFLAEKADEYSTATGEFITARQLGARLVGRWEDGTPVTLSPDSEDAAIANDTMRLNHFAYGGAEAVTVTQDGNLTRTIPGHQSDEAGLHCPFAAHVRKVNPRNLPTDQGLASRTLQFQMLRRGIPYGPLYQEGEGKIDRGLLFLAYQTSFTRQFKILNNLWMNNQSAPERGNAGHDLLVGQNPPTESRFISFQDDAGNERVRLETMSRWVISTGGAFLFSPSISFLAGLA